MRDNKEDEGQECFFEQEPQQLVHSNQEITVNLSPNFNVHLPPNELRTARRPQNMAPRTFHLQRPFYLLHKTLNQRCLQFPYQADPFKLKLKVVNKGNLSLEQYFSKKKFRCVYNRLEACRGDSRSFQGRVKPIDALVDYNWKSFKELEEDRHNFEKWQDSIDSDFEAGNICRVYVNADEEKEYYLLIENDLNTYGYNNWFFFRLKNRERGRRRFTIVNFIKKTSFFSQGMLISIFSARKRQFEGRGWFKGGQGLTFGTINLPRNHHASESYSSLSFEYDCDFEDDEVYFALNQPYTYSRLVSSIDSLKQASSNSKKVTIQVKNIGYSIANNILPSLKFTKKQSKNSQVILVLARQHPCQTVGSFIAEAMMNYLAECNKITEHLLELYDFVVVPMVNPDGVIHGSSRCNMAGLDLNRQWGDYIIKQLTPETVKIKQLIYQITKSQKIKYMIDLHGHGKKLNSFFFSCKDNEREDVKLLSIVMKKLEPRFSYQDCTYGISRDKQSTIRSTINNMGIAFSYTLQTSLYGWRDPQGQTHHFNQQDYRQLAASLIKSIFVIECDPVQTLVEVGYTKEGIINQMKPYVERQAQEKDENFDQNEIMSDSDPQGDKLDMKELMGKCENKLLKKKLQEFNCKGRKKEKKEKKEKKFNSNARCLSNSNMRSTCASALGVKAKLSVTNHGFFNKQLSIKSDIRSSSKKISLSDKWKERRKEIQKKKVLVQKQFEQRDLLENSSQRPGHSRLEERSRIRTEASNVVRPFRAHLPHSTFLKAQASRVKHPSHRLQSQFKEIQAFQTPTQEELVDSQARKSALEERFKHLKKESEGVLLTDTLSILKMNPSQKEKQQQSPSRQGSRLSVNIKKEHLSTEPNLQTKYKLCAEEPLSPEKETKRIKKFKEFMNGSSTKRKTSQLNSVFYYFPIL